MKQLINTTSVQYENRRQYKFYTNILPFLFMGMILGTIFFYLFRLQIVQNDGILKFESIKQMQNIVINYSDFYVFVLKKRITQLIIILLCACSFFSVPLLYGLVLYIGFNFSMFFYIAVYEYGFRGIIFSVLSFLPHGLLYLLFLKGICQIAVNSDSKYYHNWKAIILMLLIYVMGILTETFLNPFITHNLAMLF